MLAKPTVGSTEMLQMGKGGGGKAVIKTVSKFSTGVKNLMEYWPCQKLRDRKNASASRWGGVL